MSCLSVFGNKNQHFLYLFWMPVICKVTSCQLSFQCPALSHTRGVTEVPFSSTDRRTVPLKSPYRYREKCNYTQKALALNSRERYIHKEMTSDLSNIAIRFVKYERIPTMGYNPKTVERATDVVDLYLKAEPELNWNLQKWSKRYFKCITLEA